ncbi:apolipoprotein A-II [Eleutherodactylus coqui]|uniref:apolipoprotein A-II n=1 Tax=Eleutherodactylus coqui TaxID=57060 RepID=UPI0034635821
MREVEAGPDSVSSVYKQAGTDRGITPTRRITDRSLQEIRFLSADMKVLALTVLILAIGSLEAGVVKREVAADMKQVTELFTTFFENLKTGTQDLITKIQNGELQSQAEQFFEQTKTQTEPLKTEMEKFFAKFAEVGKNLAK